MKQEARQLLDRIEAFGFDEAGAQEPFTRRLAREQGWSHEQACAVVDEYRRFLVLAVSAAHLVSPSPQVDQAWHLHLLYTDHYRRFCQAVLGRTLDHRPSSGGAMELRRLDRAYEQTLQSYRETFEAEPPRAIWPALDERFRGGPARWVNSGQHWVIRKPERLRRLLANSLAFRLLLAAGVAVALWFSLRTSIPGDSYLHGFVALWVASWLAAILLRRRIPEQVGGPPALEPFELLQLAQGPWGAVDGAVTSLLARRTVRLNPDTGGLEVYGSLTEPCSELERCVYAQLKRDPSSRELRKQARNLTRETALRLERLGLMTSGPDLAFWLTLSAPAFGFIRVLSRLGTDKPVSILLVLCVAATAMALIARPRHRSALGDKIVRDLRADVMSTPLDLKADPSRLPLALAVFGAAALAIPAAASWREWSARQNYTASINSSSGTGCSTACGGDGGGDGGSGCGGCGGGCS